MEPTKHRECHNPSASAGAGRRGRSGNSLREPLRARSIEVRDVLDEDGTKVVVTQDDDVSRHSRRTLPMNRSRTEFISGARTAVFKTRIHAPRVARSKSVPNLEPGHG